MYKTLIDSIMIKIRMSALDKRGERIVKITYVSEGSEFQSLVELIINIFSFDSFERGLIQSILTTESLVKRRPQGGLASLPVTN